jgi:hypothetical protein
MCYVASIYEGISSFFQGGYPKRNWLDLENNIFMYTFDYDLEGVIYERTIQWPISTKSDINN